MPFIVKAPVAEPGAKSFSFKAQKTMYGGKHIAIGDEIFVFASEIQGGQGLCARGVVTAVKVGPGTRVSIEVRRKATARRPLGRVTLKPFYELKDGRPVTEIARNFYRQATNKVGGISEEAAVFLRGFF